MNNTPSVNRGYTAHTVLTTEDQQAIALSLSTLEGYGIPVSMARARYCEMLEDQLRQPDADDRRWPLEPPTQLEEHISLGNDRPTLDCHMVVGRAYALTPGQRDFIRDHHNMTPAPLVEVLECALYPDTHYIRRVTLRSVEHIDPRRRRVINKFTLDHWGRFMTESKANDAARAEAKEREAAERPVKPAKAKSGEPKATLLELMEEYGV